MWRYLLERTAMLAFTLAMGSAAIFFIVEIVPGDPAIAMLGVNARPDTLAALRAELGLDASAAERYWRWIWGMMHGDLGVSYTYGSPVIDIVAARAEVSAPLALYALALSLCLGIPLGAAAAGRPGGFLDAAIMNVTQLGIAVPNFWLAMLLVSFFSIHLGWFSAGGFAGPQEGWGAVLKSLTLPALALAVPQASILARMMRTSLGEAMNEDYIRTARAKGLSYGAALRRHGFRNALLPVLAILGLQLSFLLAGAIIVENVFFLPGLGRLIFQAVAQRDLIVVESTVFLLAATTILISYLADLASVLADPRLRRDRRRASA